jgi:hypothetical protein
MQLLVLINEYAMEVPLVSGQLKVPTPYSFAQFRNGGLAVRSVWGPSPLFIPNHHDYIMIIHYDCRRRQTSGP